MREEGKSKLRRIKTLLIRDSLSSLELEFGLCWKSHNWHGGGGKGREESETGTVPRP